MTIFPKKWLYIIGLAIIFVSEFVLRDVLLPEQARDIHIGTAVLVEWLPLCS